MNFDRLFRLALGAATVIGALGAHPALAAATGARARARAAEASNQAAAKTASGLAVFGEFLDQHPEIEARLQENPGLINNPAFLKNHPALPQFLTRNPEARAELAKRPRWLLYREMGRQSGAPMTRAQVADFDRFLDQNPGVEKALVQRPRLLRQADFVGKQAELRDYLKRHQGGDRATEPKRDRRKKADRKN
jgi:hypothetical protein